MAPLRASLSLLWISCAALMAPWSGSASAADSSCLKRTLLQMNARAQGEQFGLSALKAGTVRYLDESQRLKHVAALNPNGSSTPAEGLLDTKPGNVHLFVKDRNGRYLVLPAVDERAGIIHHSTPVAGDSVYAAGEFRFTNGKLTKLGDRSGHYLPTHQHTRQVLLDLREKGFDLREIELDLFALRELRPVELKLTAEEFLAHLKPDSNDLDTVLFALMKKEQDPARKEALSLARLVIGVQDAANLEALAEAFRRRNPAGRAQWIEAIQNARGFQRIDLKATAEKLAQVEGELGGDARVLLKLRSLREAPRHWDDFGW